MTKPPSPRKLPPLKIPPDLDPLYANLARIMHSATEMTIDFARFLPGMENPLVLSRVILSPLSAKLFHRALGENLAKYEAAFGEIPVPGGTSLADQLFSPPKPPQSE
jgi:hypothetical protein